LHLYGDFDEILEENLVKELEWLRNEFEVLFEFKREKFSENDIKLAHKIIENFVNNINILDDNRLIELISEALKDLEQNYPELFYK
jgi:hypothetical protein